MKKGPIDIQFDDEALKSREYDGHGKLKTKDAGEKVNEQALANKGCNLRWYNSCMQAVKIILKYRKMDDKKKAKLDKKLNEVPVDEDQLRIYLKEELTPKKYSEVIKVTEEIVKKKDGNDKKLSGEERETTQLKNIDVIPLTEIKTKILIAEITPGVNLLKGYTAECPSCNRKKSVSSKTLKHCSTLFIDADGENETETCHGSQGGAIEVCFEPINDTGYLCTAYDPEDASGNPQFTTLFFSNKIIPKNRKEKGEFETNIQTTSLIVEGKIRIMPSIKKINEWYIDVEEFKFEEKKVTIDFELIKKFDGVKRDGEFFAENFTPEIFGRPLQKKIMAVSLVSPHKIKLPSGVVEYGVLNSIEEGDPGQSKTNHAQALLKYCKNTNSDIISVENATNRGLIGAAQKNPSTGQWMIKVGQIPLRDGQLIILDGMEVIIKRSS